MTIRNLHEGNRAAGAGRGRLGAAIAGAIACAVLAAPDAIAQTSTTDAAQPAGFWADFGLGFASVDTSTAPFGGHDGGVLVELTLGGRLSDRWLLGGSLGGSGSQISNSNYSSTESSSNVYGQSVTHIYLVAQYQPLVDHGWYYGFGGGSVVYGNHDLQQYTGGSRSGTGEGGIGRIGYDWHVSPHGHVAVEFSAEYTHVNLSDPWSGSFHTTAIGLSAHYAHH